MVQQWMQKGSVRLFSAHQLEHMLMCLLGHQLLGVLVDVFVGSSVGATADVVVNG